MNDIDPLARIAYHEAGINPIDYAADHVIQAHLDVHLASRDLIAADPSPCPACLADLDTAVLSRRILGDLLDAGWSPPRRCWAAIDFAGAVIARHVEAFLTVRQARTADPGAYPCGGPHPSTAVLSWRILAVVADVAGWAPPQLDGETEVAR